MSHLKSWTRELVVLPLSLFLVGWIVSLVGFWMLIPLRDEVHYSPYLPSINSTIYRTILEGPVVSIFGIFHTEMPGLASSIFGIISALISAMYFVPADDTTIEGTFYELYPLAVFDTNTRPNLPVIFISLGYFMEGLSWLLFMILMIFHNYPQNEDKSQLRRSWYTHWPFTLTTTRIVSVPLICSLTILWKVLTITLVGTASIVTNSVFFIYLAVLMLARSLGSHSNRVRVYTLLFSMYVAFLTVVLIELGEELYRCTMNPSPQLQCFEMIPVYHNAIIPDSIVALSLWTCTRDLWPFSFNKCKETSGEKQRPAVATTPTVAEGSHFTGGQPSV